MIRSTSQSLLSSSSRLALRRSRLNERAAASGRAPVRFRNAERTCSVLCVSARCCKLARKQSTMRDKLHDDSDAFGGRGNVKVDAAQAIKRVL